MSRSNYDKPFYVDVGTSIVAIRCASDGDVITGLDHHGQKYIIKIIENKCERMNKEFELYAKSKVESTQPTCDWSVKDALNFANTLADHGWTRDANADAASSCIFALCRMLKNGGNAAAMREALVAARKVIKSMGGYWARETLPIIDAALSAPPRNYDRFKTKEEAEMEFMMSDGLPRDNADSKMRAWMCRFLDWLFATATKSKGDTDGGK